MKKRSKIVKISCGEVLCTVICIYVLISGSHFSYIGDLYVFSFFVAFHFKSLGLIASAVSDWPVTWVVDDRGIGPLRLHC